ncbi:MAG TPA: septal ring lytic transglycosylase RlpA family protein [Casimicrobiaceae bacterium]|nr:septal ring lytic transglycosylase RlpA family protein [Casimicrobiaceae bacterium]
MPCPAFRRQCAALLTCAALLAACHTSPPKPSTPSGGAPSGRYYKDDGPGEAPANLDQVPDAVPRLEPLNRFANRPYTVLGQDYVPATTLRPYKERGVASWYGKMFHGQKTSIGETYDMYAMTAAHPTLPLPSYARVTNVVTGQSVIVRVNDRGPFLQGRIIDLSYAAAHRVGIAARGSGEVEVESIIPGESPMLTAQAPLPPVARAVEAVPAAPVTAQPPQPQAAGGYAVQLGAFQSYNNAQNFLTHVQGQLADAKVEPKVREANGLYRVYVGPYADRDEARRVADRITNVFGMATTVAPH